MVRTEGLSAPPGPFSERNPVLLFLLRAASFLYGLGVRLRLFLYKKGLLSSRRLPLKVLSIGNLSSGGTGKTPHTALLALYLKGLGLKTAVLSRGYRGTKMKKGAVISDGRSVTGTIEEGGEEPVWLARNLAGIPVLVGRDRYRSGLFCHKTWQSEWVVLDDGFQHLQLHRDINLLLVSGHRPLSSDRLLPRGSLREPIKGMDRADAILVTHSERVEKAEREQISKALNERVPSRPVFFSRHQPIWLKPILGEKKLPLSLLEGKKVIGFCGLADPGSFEFSLRQLGADPVRMIPFADHHFYEEKDKIALEEMGRQARIDYLVTTEKDAVKLGKWTPPDLPLLVLGITIEILEREFYEWLDRKVRPGI
ncbi:MAG: tetraacyldisaccharide 4'-kinase [Thermodesulfobacteriota bacterium]